jgi:hypothetical protein
LFRALGLDSAEGIKRVYNRRFRLKEDIFERYPRFVQLCEFHKITCPEDNNWAYHAYPNTKTPEKSPHKSPLNMPRFKTSNNTQLLKNGGVGDDDEIGKSHECLTYCYS